jgi:hypothetical protein
MFYYFSLSFSRNLPLVAAKCRRSRMARFVEPWQLELRELNVRVEVVSTWESLNVVEARRTSLATRRLGLFENVAAMSASRSGRKWRVITEESRR